MAKKKLPTVCPSCGQVLTVKSFACGDCGTAIEGGFALPALARLGAEEQEFVLNFVLASGSLKELAKRYRVSYPTVRNRLDALIEQVRALQAENNGEKNDD